MGQCTSCSPQRPNINSSVPQTPEFELSPNYSLFGIPTSNQINSSAELPTLPTEKIKSRLSQLTLGTPSSTTPSGLRQGVKSGDKESDLPDGNCLSSTVSADNSISHHLKSSKKHRVSPQTTSATGIPKRVSFWNKDKVDTSGDLSDTKSAKQDQVVISKSSFVSLRKILFLQSKNSSESKLKSSTTLLQPGNDRSSISHDNDDTKQRLEINSDRVFENNTLNEATNINNSHYHTELTEPDNINCPSNISNDLDKLCTKLRTSLQHSKISVSSNSNQDSVNNTSISSVTLQDLNSSREEKKLLRELFFLGIGTANTNTSTSNIISGATILPPPFTASTMTSNTNNSNTNLNRPSRLAYLQNAAQKIPEKGKRTFQYQPPVQSTISSSLKAADVNVNLSSQRYPILTSKQAEQFKDYSNNNLHHHGEINNSSKQFGQGGSQIHFRRYPNFTPHVSTALLPEDKSTAISQQLTSGNNNNNIQFSLLVKPGSNHNYNFVKKPIETKPFYTQFYSNRNLSKQVLPNPPSAAFGFDRVSTGVVSQHKMFYQGRIAEENSTKKSNSTSPGIVRSTTWVKDTISSSAKKYGDKMLPKSISTDNASSLQQSHVNVKEGPTFQRGERGMNAKSNFPLQHDSSSSSGASRKCITNRTSASCQGGGDNHQNVISDSEYLDDEISDQPDLTLTFKDLSPSSSGESLLSCDLMLDLTIQGKKRTGRGDGDHDDSELTSDSAFSDISSANPSSFTKILSNDRLSSPKNRPGSGPAIASTPISKQIKTNFVLRNVQQITPTNTNARTQVGKARTEPLLKYEKHSIVKENSKQDPYSELNTAKVRTALQKSPSRITKKLVENSSSPSEDSQKEEINESFMKHVIEDISNMKHQLHVLKSELEEKERVDVGKDLIIEKLMLEIDFLKRVGAVERKVSIHNCRTGEAFSRNGLQLDLLDCERSTVNAAAQTDSDTISPMRGVSYDECDKFGEMVSFRIGRRIPPTPTPNASDKSDPSIG